MLADMALDPNALRQLIEARYENTDRGVRETAWRALDDLYMGEHEALVKQRIDVTHPNRKEKWNLGKPGMLHGHQYVELLDGVYVDRLAVMFRDPPELKLVNVKTDEDASEAEQEQWAIDQEASEIDEVLPEIENRTLLFWETLVSPAWRRGRVSWDIHGPHDLKIVPDTADPMRLNYARVVQIKMNVRQMMRIIDDERVKGVDGLTDGQSIYQLWAFDEAENTWNVFVVDEDGGITGRQISPNGISPYMVVDPKTRLKTGYPFVLWRARRPRKGEILAPPRYAWLLDGMAADLRKMDADHLLRFQAHKQLVTYGWTENEEKHYGPDTALSTKRPPDEARAEVLDTHSDFKGSIDMGDHLLRVSAVANSFPGDTFSAGSTTRNAFAKKIEHHSQMMHRKKRRRAMVRALRHTFLGHKAVGNYHAANPARGEPKRTVYAPTTVLAVTLAPIPFPRDEWQSAQADGERLKQGATDVIEIVSRRDGITRDEAEKLVVMYKETNKRFPVETTAPGAATAGGGIMRPPDVQEEDED